MSLETHLHAYNVNKKNVHHSTHIHCEHCEQIDHENDHSKFIPETGKLNTLQRVMLI